MIGRVSRQRRRDEDGVIAVIVAICAVSLFVIAALVVDLGLARDTRRQSQNAADASALAAANALYPTGTCKAPTGGNPPCLTDAVAEAKAYAEANFSVESADWAACAAPPSGYTAPVSSVRCVSFDSLTSPKRVWMVMPDREVHTGFGVLADVQEISVGARARAVVESEGMSSCGLCMLGKNMQHYIQTGEVLVTGTSVHANGNLGTQHVNGHVAVINGTVSVQGTISGNVISQQNTANAGEVLDPLAGFVLPSAANNWHGTPSVPRPKSNPCNEGPGFYNSISLSGPGTCVLQAGTYVIAGELRVTGQRSVNASAGVTLYFTCGTGANPTACADGGQAGGSMTFAGQGGLSISPPTSGPLKGLSIASDRNNTSTLDFRGNGAGSVKGTIYAASGTMKYRGNGAGVTDSLVVVRDLSFSGTNSLLSLVYTAGNNVELPPSDPALDR